MRRKDREVTDTSKIEDIISSCTCCRLGFNDNGEVYIVPLNFGFCRGEQGYVFYFHGAHEGRKIELIRQAPQVGFEMDTGHRVRKGDTAYECTASFQSIIGTGTVSIVEDLQEKRHGLLCLMKHDTGRDDWEFTDRQLEEVCVFRLNVASFSCKEHL